MASMIQKLVFDKVGMTGMERMVDMAATRHKLLASNIANATSPGYQRRDIDFQSELSEAMHTRKVQPRATRSGHIVSTKTMGDPQVTRDDGGVNASDVSGVDMDKEMAQVAVNTLNYQTGMTIISKQFKGLRTAINGGR